MPRIAVNVRARVRASVSTACNQTIEIERAADNVWVVLDSAPATTLESERLALQGGALSTYIYGSAATGEMRVRVRCTNTAAAFATSTDLVAVTYDLP